jgi:hypothetical protein
MTVKKLRCRDTNVPYFVIFAFFAVGFFSRLLFVQPHQRCCPKNKRLLSIRYAFEYYQGAEKYGSSFDKAQDERRMD